MQRIYLTRDRSLQPGTAATCRMPASYSLPLSAARKRRKKGPDPMKSLSICLGLTFWMSYGVMETEYGFVSISVFLASSPSDQAPKDGYYVGLVP